MYTQITRIASMATVVLALPRIARMAAPERLSLSRVATKALRGLSGGRGWTFLEPFCGHLSPKIVNISRN